MANYQVVTARGVSYKLVDNDGKELTRPPRRPSRPDTVNLQFQQPGQPQGEAVGAPNITSASPCTIGVRTARSSSPIPAASACTTSRQPGPPAHQHHHSQVLGRRELHTDRRAIKQAGWPGVPTHRGITYARWRYTRFQRTQRFRHSWPSARAERWRWPRRSSSPAS